MNVIVDYLSTSEENQFNVLKLVVHLKSHKSQEGTFSHCAQWLVALAFLCEQWLAALAFLCEQCLTQLACKRDS